MTDAAAPDEADDGPTGAPAACWSAVSGVRGAPPCVLVHGSMDRSAGLLRLARRLADAYTVVRYDRRGYGSSAAMAAPSGIAEQVDDLVGVLRSAVPVPTPAALVFGHSYGGNVALALAERHPELVAAVAVYETPMPWLDWWPNDTAGAAALGGGTPEDAAERFMRRLVGDRKWERLPPSTRAARRAEGRAMVAELADLRRRPPWTPARVRAPVLALRGERARPHHEQGVATMAASMPSCTVAVVPGAGHVGPNTHADDVAALLTAFEREVASPSVGR